MNQTRAELSIQARKFGIQEEVVNRMSVHALKIEVDACVKRTVEAARRRQVEIEKDKRRQERKQQKKLEEQEREETIRIEEQRREEQEKEEQERQEREREEQEQEEQEKDDKLNASETPFPVFSDHPSDASDTETVIDMSHVTDTVNPGDQKFARFQFLVKTRTVLLETLSKNEELVEKMKTELDNDDLALLHKCLHHDSECLAQIKLEMTAICVWFEESRAEKQALYHELCSQLVGPSASQARKHFASKVAKMDENIKFIRLQIVECETEEADDVHTNFSS